MAFGSPVGVVAVVALAAEDGLVSVIHRNKIS